MTEAPETRDENGREELARRLYESWVADQDAVDPEDANWCGLEDEDRDGWLAHVAVIESAGWVSPAAVAGRDAEVERLLAAWQSAAQAAQTHLTDLVERDLRLGAVAALADEWTCNCGGPSPEGRHEMHCDSYYGDRLRAALGPVSGAVEGAGAKHSASCGVLRCGACEREEDVEPLPVTKSDPDPELLVLQVYERGEWVTQVGYSWTPDDLAKAQDKAETSMFTARVVPVYATPTAVAVHEQEVRGEAIDRFVDAHRKSIDYLLRSADDPVYEDDVAAANHLRSRAGGMSYVVDALVALAARSSGSSAPVQGDEA